MFFLNPFWFIPAEAYVYLLLPAAGVVEVPADTGMLIPGVGMVYGS